MEKTLIVYSTKYGSTGTVVRKLAPILGPSAVITPTDFEYQHRAFDAVVIGSPVYGEKPLPEIEDFVSEHLGWLSQKRVALFSVSLSMDAGTVFPELRAALGKSVVATASIGGLFEPAVLCEEDLLSAAYFLRRAGLQMARKDRSDNVSLAEQALSLKRRLMSSSDMPQELLRRHVDEFLLSHNTCTLVTGCGSALRATPAEYTYVPGGALYMFMEGGEQFANLLLNPHVAAAVCEPYEGSSCGSGLQVEGKAERIPFGTEEYRRIAFLRGLDFENLKNLPVTLHLLKVSLSGYEFRCSSFPQEGYKVRQALHLG